MKAPNILCTITAYCTVEPSEDPKKVEHAISNILLDTDIEINLDSITATSTNLESLSKIYETIQSRKIQKTYRYHLNKNLINNLTWFYLNKQAAFVNTISLCGEMEESPLGPIKIILKSDEIEQIIEWLITY